MIAPDLSPPPALIQPAENAILSDDERRFREALRRACTLLEQRR